MADIIIETPEDLRAEVMVWQGQPYIDLLAAAQGTEYEANVRVLGTQMTELNRDLKYGVLDVARGTIRFNQFIDMYNTLVSSIEDYTGFGYYAKAVYTAAAEAPGKVLDIYEDVRETVRSYGAGNLLLYGGIALGAGILLYAFVTSYGKGLAGRLK